MDIYQHIKDKFKIQEYENIPLRGESNSTREDLVDLFSELDFKVGAEIGVWEGTFSKIILQRIKDVNLSCIDAWELYNEVGSERKIRRLYQTTIDTLSPYPNAKIIRKRSQDALNLFEDGSLDFVYIDAAHDFDNVMMDVIGWTKKVRSKGIVSGHDYVELHRRSFDFGVQLAVDTYTAAHKLCLYITQDRYHSWFFVKN